MPFTFKPKPPQEILLSHQDQQFTLILNDIPSTTLFELAQVYGEHAATSRTKENRAYIPAAFARLVLDTVIDSTKDWQGVLNHEGKPLPFDKNRLRAVIHSEIAFIPQLINHVAEFFALTCNNQKNLEDEEKN